MLVDDHRPGWGASGRNGGQVSSGQRVSQLSLEKDYGDIMAKKLWQISQDAKDLVTNLILKYKIKCDLIINLSQLGGVNWLNYDKLLIKSR